MEKGIKVICQLKAELSLLAAFFFPTRHLLIPISKPCTSFFNTGGFVFKAPQTLIMPGLKLDFLGMCYYFSETEKQFNRESFESIEI